MAIQKLSILLCSWCVWWKLHASFRQQFIGTLMHTYAQMDKLINSEPEWVECVCMCASEWFVRCEMSHLHGKALLVVKDPLLHNFFRHLDIFGIWLRADPYVDNSWKALDCEWRNIWGHASDHPMHLWLTSTSVLASNISANSQIVFLTYALCPTPSGLW